MRRTLHLGPHQGPARRRVSSLLSGARRASPPANSAARAGPLQDLPFKETKLPPLSPLRPSHFGSGLSGRALPALRPGPDRGASPDPLRWADGSSGRPLSPDPARPMSPDGLGGGLYSSVFVDTGVEGLLQPSPLSLRERRWVGGPGCAAHRAHVHAA